MRPESATTIVRPELALYLSEFDAEGAAKRFIGRRAAPIYVSDNQTGEYGIVNRESFQKRTDSHRAEGAGYARITGKVSKATYSTEEYGLEETLDDRQAARLRPTFELEQLAIRHLWYQMLLDYEYRVHAAYTGLGLTNTNVSTAWTTTDSAKPINDFQTQFDNLAKSCGAAPSDLSIIIPQADWRELLAVAQVNDKIKYTYPGIQPAELTGAQVANMLGVKEVLIAGAYYDTTEEGYAASLSAIWTSGVIYIGLLSPEGAPLNAESAFRTVVWNEGSNGDSLASNISTMDYVTVESYRDEVVRGDVIRARWNTDEVAMGDADLFVRKLTNT